MMHTFFTSNEAFENEFQRCCLEYHNVEMYIAWIGDPKNVIPFKYLSSLSEIQVLVGIAFCQSDPDGIKYLMEATNNVRIAKEDVLYHPKVYIFSNENKKALFIGSSNLTYQGFHVNQEANVLIEADANNMEIKNFEEDLRKWLSNDFSFIPTNTWLKKYVERYKKRREKVRKAGLDDEAEKEEQFTTTAWLANADWNIYIKKIESGIRRHSKEFHESFSQKMHLLDKCSTELSLPWTSDYFKVLEKRKLIGGMYPYGWLGHVAASGDFRRMLKNGSSSEHRTIVNAINTIGELSIPVNYEELKLHLDNLVALGPTMKVWGRLLAIVRPDLFCTISAPRVRKAIAIILNQPENAIQDVDGYIWLLSLIHSSPWFNSPVPKEKNEIEIWKRRAAFLDVVFY